MATSARLSAARLNAFTSIPPSSAAESSPMPPFGIHEQNLSFVHQLSWIEAASRLRNDPPHERVHQQFPNFVLNRCDGLSPEVGRVFFELVFSEIEQLRVDHAGENAVPEGLIGEHPGNVEQCGVWQ